MEHCIFEGTGSGGNRPPTMANPSVRRTPSSNDVRKNPSRPAPEVGKVDANTAAALNRILAENANQTLDNEAPNETETVAEPRAEAAPEATVETQTDANANASVETGNESDTSNHQEPTRATRPEAASGMSSAFDDAGKSAKTVLMVAVAIIVLLVIIAIAIAL